MKIYDLRLNESNELVGSTSSESEIVLSAGSSGGAEIDWSAVVEPVVSITGTDSIDINSDNYVNLNSQSDVNINAVNDTYIFTQNNLRLNTVNNLYVNTTNNNYISSDNNTYISAQNALYFDAYNGNSVTINANGSGSSIDLYSNDYVNIYGDQGGFSIYTDGTTYYDNGTNGGIKYSEDYSEYYTERSLVDKAYVDGKYISNSFSTTASAQSLFTVTIGETVSAGYKVIVTPASSLASANFYIANKGTTSFDVVYASGLTGLVAFDWVLYK